MKPHTTSLLNSISLTALFGLLGLSSAQAAPDVTVIGTPVVSPRQYFAGGPLQVTYTVKNIGNQTAVASDTRVQIFTPFSTQFATAEFPIAALAAGAQRTETHTITVNNEAWSGTWDARVRLDTNFEIPENGTANNVATPVPFQLVATKPDLKFDGELAPGPCPSPNAYGGTVRLAFLIHNDSSVPAPASKTRVQIYDRSHTAVVVDQVPTPAIPAHGKVPFVYSYQLPATGTPGSWSVFVVLNDFLPDMDETGAFNNNGDEISFQVAAAGTAVTPCPITPALMNPRVEGTNVAFDIWANAGSTVNLSSSTDLKTWIPLASPVVTKGVNKFTVPRSGPKRYYRAK